jgi:undecaprenyl-diphosphatase
MEWFESLVLGVVQGVTEFLPISSDGHLSVAQMLFARLTGRSHSEADDFFFDVMLHLGTLCAILLHYRHQIRAGARGLLGHVDVPDLYKRKNVVRVGLLAILATLPLVPDKLFFMDMIKKAGHSPLVTGIGFLITAGVLAVTAWLKGGEKGPEETRWIDALLIGLAQAFAPLPGVSRSGLTIASALALGFRRSWAVGFSLLLAVPAILGASVSELKDLKANAMTTDRIAQTVAAAALAGMVGYWAIVWLVRIVRSGRFWYFSVYLVVLGLVLILAFPRSRDRSDAGREAALDGPIRGSLAGERDRRRTGRQKRALARAFSARARPGGPRADAAAGNDNRPPSLVLGRALDLGSIRHG